MSDEHYQTRTVITKNKRDEGKIKRWVVNPVMKVASFEVKDSKKDRVSA